MPVSSTVWPLFVTAWARTAFLCFLARAMTSVTNALRGSASEMSGS
ncbi:hypothetical protein [Streptomyces sp. RK62]|nr:hypothetical protein [Streptomyces sp. RK62]MBQ0997518.1 hypothetical protein [Streptomyces sp. RK62]